MNPRDIPAGLSRLVISAVAFAALTGVGVLEARMLRDGNRPVSAGAVPRPPAADGSEPRAAERPQAAPVRLERLLVRRGDTLAALLRGRGLTGAQVAAVAEALAPVYPLRRLRPGDELTLGFVGGTAEGGARLVRLVLRPGPRREIVVRADGGGDYVASVESRRLAREVRRAAGKIESSLFASARSAEIPAAVIAAVIREFSYQVDFQRDLRRGDRFDVLWEALVDEDGREVGAEPFLWALLTTGGLEHEILRFDDPAGGGAGYYEPDGRSARKTLMRTPVDGARLTSGFGMRRHPILGYTRRHAGVDFAAPAGTPVWAAGDGVVVEAGWNGGYGRWIRLRHGGGFETGYAHLSRIEPGIRAGVQVHQGQVIGRVGATGLASAPHLHYEVFRGGRRVDPRTVDLPAAAALSGAALAAFERQRDRVLALLAPFGSIPETVARGETRLDRSLRMKQ